MSEAKRRRLDAVLVTGQSGIRALTGIDCDSARLVLRPFEVAKGRRVALYTDFRYAAMVRRVAPWIAVRTSRDLHLGAARAGCEFSMPHSRFEALRKANPRTRFADVGEALSALRAVKTAAEVDGIRHAEEVTCGIWNEASAKFRAGMTEREMANVIRAMMFERGDGEAFDTIVCVGANAAECHHVPDGTVWNGREPVLVDMGARVGGYCSDLTRNLVPARQGALYRRVYSLVLKANLAAIAAVKPGRTCGEIDAVARRIIRDGGFGRCFGHSLGHGVGFDVHEAPVARRGNKAKLEPGMTITIEPGVYLEGNLGVRIEDLVLVTGDGCEVLSSAAGKQEG